MAGPVLRARHVSKGKRHWELTSRQTVTVGRRAGKTALSVGEGAMSGRGREWWLSSGVYSGGAGEASGRGDHGICCRIAVGEWKRIV